MKTDIKYTIQLESIPYLIKNKVGKEYYCCKGLWTAGSVQCTKILIYFDTPSLQCSHSVNINPSAFIIIRKIRNLDNFLKKIQIVNHDTQFVINGKEI